MNEKTKNVSPLIRTDLAYDDYEFYQNQGISDFENSKYQVFDIPIFKSIVGKKASETIGKKEGTYYTVDLTELNIHDSKTIENVEKALASVLKNCLEENKLLGKNTIVTRHLAINNTLSEGFSNVSAMSPGVMGTTGIETYDVISTMSDKIGADFVIIVDALATNSIKRINKTIQITDTGIKPGSGVGNKRKEISYDTINKPVIAIGIPTVVDATTITVDTIQMVLKYLNLAMNNGTSKANNITMEPVKEDLTNSHPSNDTNVAFFGNFGNLSETEQRTLVEEVLTPQGYNLMVTPKEIDMEVEDLSKIIANSLNIALHPGLFNGYTS